ncbi:MAG: rod shape-determining protein [Clostridia bacterium]|nr:rod shape-determining protein [Clostridia bacterium]
MAKIVGIDLGTANTLICTKGKGIVLRSPSVVAISKADRSVVALGKEARRMLGKTPEGILAFRPLKDGVIADPEVTSKMIRAFFEYTDSISLFARPSAIVCIPFGVTEVEKRAVEDATFEAGARSVALIEEPLAAAIGTGLRVGGARGSMIVDIGGGTTEVAVISLGGIVASNSVRVAGDEFDEAIISYLRRRRGILIGSATAEALKIKIGSAHPSCDGGEMEVCGRSLDSGLGAVMKIHSSEVREAISGNLEQIIFAIKKTLEQTPPELSADIYDFGIMLSGGGALLRGIDRLISERTGIQVKIAQRPLESVCTGILRVIESEGKLGNLLQYRGR